MLASVIASAKLATANKGDQGRYILAASAQLTKLVAVRLSDHSVTANAIANISVGRH